MLFLLVSWCFVPTLIQRWCQWKYTSIVDTSDWFTIWWKELSIKASDPTDENVETTRKIFVHVQLIVHVLTRNHGVGFGSSCKGVHQTIHLSWHQDYRMVQRKSHTLIYCPKSKLQAPWWATKTRARVRRPLHASHWLLNVRPSAQTGSIMRLQPPRRASWGMQLICNPRLTLRLVQQIDWRESWLKYFLSDWN